LERYATFKWLIYFIAFAFLTISTLILLDLIKNHYEDWISDNDLHQSQIWENIDSNDLKNDKVFVTDRMGEPVFYFLFYEKIDPKYFIENRVVGPILNGQIQRIDSVGNVTFESGEFVGQNLDYSNINNIANGQIIKKITGVNSESKKFFGDEIWFVKTSVE
jgi:hypothetical protein